MKILPLLLLGLFILNPQASAVPNDSAPLFPTQLQNAAGTVINPATSDNQTNSSQKTQVVDGSANVQGPFTTISGVNYAPVTRPTSYTTGNLTSACTTPSSCAATSVVSLIVPEGQTNWDVYLSGIFSITSTVIFEGSLDGTNWFYLNGRISGSSTTNPGTTLLTSSVSGGANPPMNYPLTGGNPSNFRGNLAGAKYMRVRCSAFTTGDSIAVQISTTTGISAIFQNAAQPATADVFASGTFSAVNSTLMVPTNGLSTCALSISGTWVGTIAFQGSVDNGSTYPFSADTIVVPGGATVTSTTTNNQYKAPVGGFTEFQLKMTAYTSGSASIIMDCGSGPTVDRVFSTNAASFLASSYLFDALGNSINSVSNALNVNTQTNHIGTPTETSVSCGTTSTTLLAASSASSFISIRNPTTSGTTIWINIAGSAATTAVPSIDLAPGSEADYTASENSFLPTAQINCISGGSASSVALTYK